MTEGSAPADSERGSQPTVIVSACLLGVRCNHEGEANTSEAVVQLRATHRVVPICPESAGGLPTPRARAERRPDGRVVTADGVDVTEWFERGAAHAVKLAEVVGATRAVLKARSPSCGCHEIYDGSFTGKRVAGDGVTAEALRRAGLDVVSEAEVSQ
jgi:uncharacterized protein YbbK (DUF523 family)